MRLLYVVVALTGCGRIGFTPYDIDDGGTTDTVMTDGAEVSSSCGGLPATCGPTGVSPCCDNALVAGGTFFRGHDVGTDGLFPSTAATAVLRPFRLDTYEVTVGRFRKFFTAGMGTQQSAPAAGAGARMLNNTNEGGWSMAWNTQLPVDSSALSAALACDAVYATWTAAPGANEDLPINCVTWYEAMAFCIWDGGFLPTEAELDFASVGGDEQRAYPWSNPPSSLAISCTNANYSPGGVPCTSPPTGAVDRVGRRSPAGDGRWGHADLAGNVREWMLDLYRTPYPATCMDCAALTSGLDRDASSGDFTAIPSSMRGANRSYWAPTDREYIVGVRCARLP